MDSLATILPQLGVGALSLLVLAYQGKLHGDKMEAKDKTFMAALQERETAFRVLEKEVRTSIMTQLAENTYAFKQVLAHFNTHNG